MLKSGTSQRALQVCAPLFLLLFAVSCERTASTPGGAASSGDGKAQTAQPPLQTQEPIELKGDRNGNSRPFKLTAGNYRVSWRAYTDDRSNRCAHFGRLVLVAGGYDTNAGGGVVSPSAAGSSYLYNVPSGQFYYESVSGCAWSVTIDKQ
jgi:hypothetical protein